MKPEQVRRGTIGDSATPFWAMPLDSVWQSLKSSASGLQLDDAQGRLKTYGPNSYRPTKKRSPVLIFLSQLTSPIVLLLIAAAILSFALGDTVNAGIIFFIILASAGLSFTQEFRASQAVEQLLALVESKSTVVRGGQTLQVSTEEVVPGDIVVINAGTIIPGDGLILEATNLYVDQAALTGESFPSEKEPGVVEADAEPSKRSNTVFSGTHVISGSAKIVIVKTGRDTEFGDIIDRISSREPETDFERGVRKFGTMLLEVTLLLTIGVFAVNVYLHRPALDSFMFALALAVGLTPQLLPAIISVNLSHGAQEMAKKKVIVKRMNAIENFGSMNLLCSDKTGTLTKGVVEVQSCLTADGKTSDDVLKLARLNAKFQTGFSNPIDEALNAIEGPLEGYERVAEIPYDFTRKRLGVIVKSGNETTLITKGALEPVLEICTQTRTEKGLKPLAECRQQILDQFAEQSAKGFRVLGIATRVIDGAIADSPVKEEHDLCYEGLLVLGDPLREGIVDAVKELESLGIRIKVITGDNRLAAAHLGESLSFKHVRVATGADLRQLSDNALVAKAKTTDIFAEIEPDQKERLIRSLQKGNFVVGYIGDGINDASALHAADVGISVANAVSVAKEAADMVMLESGLAVLVSAVTEGRRTFANTMKYVLMATSANFGNMFSMAGASMFLPFLPLLPKQVLLNNLMTDLPEMALASDSVDEEVLARPRRWSIAFVRKFMMVFGALNSAADYATFGVLMLMRAPVVQFRTAWFIENIISATIAVFVVRSRRPFFRSKPGNPLIWATVASISLTLILPWTSIGALLGFAPLPGRILIAIVGIVLVYLVVVEYVKRVFYRHVGRHA